MALKTKFVLSWQTLNKHKAIFLKNTSGKGFVLVPNADELLRCSADELLAFHCAGAPSMPNDTRQRISDYDYAVTDTHRT